MDWSLLLLLAIGGGFLLWRQSKNAEKAQVANERLAKDNKLYQRIKEGMREYHWREREQDFWKAKNGQLLFETAHLAAYHVDHFAESRVGFYFKDLNEYGLYGFFAGNGDEFFESYYRTDKTFQEEGRLLHDDD
ncbi:hypothetical protein [Bradyrhizobium sp. NC92]|uniref:hypothetical protein n=1 Tax=Bradyrhizobium sp. (strain NC92) TaxID=55395 RepID=UPI0021AA162F|nr:hypothetical protein [Bradyrhizobium sp. NC92]UWU66114.1 hypothetical protein N2602_22960 [Bradyrhizobium sp. NC92]